MALPFKIRIHTKIILIHLLLDIDIPPLTANGHGYRKPIDLLQQLPSYALHKFVNGPSPILQIF